MVINNGEQYNEEQRGGSLLGRILVVVVALFLFLLSIELISTAFGHLGRETAQSIIAATSNPFIGLFIGLLITAIIQSSSTTTSMVVAVVASGGLGLSQAIPIIMGANIGTTLTSSLVSLGFITKKNEFRKAISAGTVHDFFNIFTTAILFPLEYEYNFLSGLSRYITSLITLDIDQGEAFSLSFFKLEAIAAWILELVQIPGVVVVIAFLFLFGSIKLLSSLISKIVIGGSRDRLNKYFFQSPARAFWWGTAITGGVQSSSITTSLMVPLVATGKIPLRKAYSFILGANIGTTITALLAALFKSDAAVSIALVHLLFNLIGVLIFLPFPVLRRIPVGLASALGRITMNHRIIGFMYIIIIFFLLPFALIYLNKDMEIASDLPTTEVLLEEPGQQIEPAKS
ncbi:Na/Pi symporter [Roseivirga sp. BDSF3-8]|uniref:Na/Pi symporter n=1 Tax=Roseivirga sp. BDSF3-8 TaxID=3241598 RepID=UPI0035324C1D